MRLFAILVSYPFVIIYSVLDLDNVVSEVARGMRKVLFLHDYFLHLLGHDFLQVEVLGIDVSLFFKNARRFVVTTNIMLIFMPVFLVRRLFV